MMSSKALLEDKQQNTLDELKKLKISIAVGNSAAPTFIPISSRNPNNNISSNDSISDNGSVRSQTLKLAQRRSSKLSEDSFSERGSVSGSGHHHLSAVQEIENLKYQLKAATNERDLIMEEKKYWLSKVQEENAYLETALQNLNRDQETASKLIQELQDAANRFKAMNFVGDRDDLLFYIREKCTLAPTHLESIPEDRRLLASEIYDVLDMLTSRSVSNIVDVVHYILSLVQDIEASFYQNDDLAVEEILFQLKVIASSSPNNIHSCQNLLEMSKQSNEEFDALQDSLAKALANKYVAQLSIEKHEKSNLDHVLQSLGSGQVLESDLLHQALNNVLISNEHLKVKLEHYKKRNTQLRNKLSHPTQRLRYANFPNKKSSFSSMETNDKEISNRLNSLDSDYHHQQLEIEEAIDDKFDMFDAHRNGDKPFLNPGNQDTIDREGDEDDVDDRDEEEFSDIVLNTEDFTHIASNWSSLFDCIHPTIRDSIWTLVMSHVHRLVAGHPLARRFPVSYVQAVVTETCMNIRGFVGQGVAKYLSQLPSLSTADHASIDTLLQNGDLESLVKKILQSQLVHHELVCNITLLVSFIFYQYQSSIQAPAETTLPTSNNRQASLKSVLSSFPNRPVDNTIPPIVDPPKNNEMPLTSAPIPTTPSPSAIEFDHMDTDYGISPSLVVIKPISSNYSNTGQEAFLLSETESVGRSSLSSTIRSNTPRYMQPKGKMQSLKKNLK